MKNDVKKTRKERVKLILFKILHVVCYILSVLFILACVIGGVQSCNKPKSVNAEEHFLTQKRLPSSFNNYVCYEFKYNYSDVFDITLQQQKSYFPSLDLDRTYSSAQSNKYHTVYRGTGYCLLDNNRIVEFDRFSLAYSTYLGELEVDYKYRLSNISIYESNGSYHYFVAKQYQYYDDLPSYNISTHYVPKLYLTEKITDNSFINDFFDLVPTTNFTFNKQFNYNAPLGTNISGLYGSTSFDSSGDNMRYKNFNVGYFYSNGQLFNQIQYWCIQSEGNHVLMGNNDIQYAPSGYWIYSFMYYRNTDTNTEVLVNYHDLVPFSHDNSTSKYYGNSSTWVNDQFRFITFFEPLSESLTISINAFNNNNQSYYDGQIYTDGNDIFTLLSLGFSSLSEFWAINILPGISIGVLFFLPAVVGIIITIVHLLRK